MASAIFFSFSFFSFSRVTNFREPAGIAVILRGYHPWFKIIITDMLYLKKGKSVV